MSPPRLLALVVLTMIAFAANSVLCRLALTATTIDAATFTTVRLVAGALVLGLIVRGRGRRPDGRRGDWPSAVALFVYAAAFSFAYLTLTVGTGALLLFGTVQLTMIAAGLRAGERLDALQSSGLLLALGGFVFLVLPGLAAPPLAGAALMTASGTAWGVYSLRGRRATRPLAETSGNFLRAAPLAVFLSLPLLASARVDAAGIAYAVASGALASGVGYAVWYTVLPHLRAVSAATVQLSVPALAALGGFVFLGEPVTRRLLVSSVAILGGIAVVLLRRSSAQK